MSKVDIDFPIDEDNEQNMTLLLSEMFERDSRRYNRPFSEEQEVSTE